MTIYLIQCAGTDWQAEGRMQGRLSLPLSAVGQEQSDAVARRLAEADLGAVYCPEDEACVQTARAIAAEHRGCRVRKLADLAEVNLGLWQGMRVEEVKRRQPRVYRQWLDEPTSVTPPEGEGFEEAFERIGRAVRRVLRRHAGGRSADAVVVTRPLAAALVRCCLNRGRLADIWRMVSGDPMEPESFQPEAAENE